MNMPTLFPRAVLYTNDLEPITVIDLSPVAMHYLLKKGSAVLAVWEEFKFVPVDESTSMPKVRTVRIRAEEFRYRNARSLMLFTDDEEDALLMRAAFLPGQTKAKREVHANGFKAGFLAAIQALGA